MEVSKFKEDINIILSDLNDLIPEVVKDIIRSDVKAINNNKPWYHRHRLGVLIESANKAHDMIDKKIIYSPWFLSELKSYVSIIKKWKTREEWGEIKSSLIDIAHFKHTMLKLTIARARGRA
jgi:hypothetical protein